MLSNISLFTFYFLMIVHLEYEVKASLTDANPAVSFMKKILRLPLEKQVNLSDIETLLWKNLNEELSQNHSNSSCSNSLKGFVEDVANLLPDALQIVDSWGRPESGIWDGNIVFEGRYFQCLNARFGNISSQYCRLYLALPKPLVPDPGGNAAIQLLSPSINLCLPSTCSAKELNDFKKSNGSSGIFQGISCINTNDSWSAIDILALFVTCTLALLVCLSTLYDVTLSYKSNNSEKMNRYEPSTGSSTDIPNFSTPPPPSANIKRRLLLSFSVIQNTNRLFSTVQKPTDIKCLHGVRFFSLSWVVLGHSFFIIEYADNVRFIARYATHHFEFQAVINALLAVDSFFYLSGLLVVYLGMRQLKRRGGKLNVPLMYFYRYFRLTPPYAFLILFSITILPKMGDGPMWQLTTQPLIDSCSKYWYTNLLYFNNLYPVTMQEECFGWGWYLANDTQFFLLTPLFLWLLYKCWIIGFALIGFFLLTNLSVTGAFSSYTKQQTQPASLGLLAKAAAEPIFPSHNSTFLSSLGDFNAAAPKTYNPYISDLYTKPWCRIGAYLVGMATGYVLHASSNKLNMKKITVALGWITASVVSFLLVYCAFPSYSKGELWSVELAAFYNAVSRPLWCVGLAWITIACVNGYGGPVNTLLSWKAFIPLSRLSYCTYLVHPLVLHWFHGTSEVPLHYSIYLCVQIFLSVLVFSTMLAYTVAMLVEFPVVELLKIMQGSMDKLRPTSPLHQQDAEENSLLPSSDPVEE